MAITYFLQHYIRKNVACLKFEALIKNKMCFFRRNFLDLSSIWLKKHQLQV